MKWHEVKREQKGRRAHVTQVGSKHEPIHTGEVMFHDHSEIPFLKGDDGLIHSFTWCYDVFLP